MTDKKIVQKVVLAGVVVREGKVLIVQRRSDETADYGITGPVQKVLWNAFAVLSKH